MPLPTGVYRADQVGSLLRPKEILQLREKIAASGASVTELRRLEDKYIADVSKTLSARLAEQGFAADVTGRAKHLYSVYRKMKAQETVQRTQYQQ